MGSPSPLSTEDCCFSDQWTTLPTTCHVEQLNFVDSVLMRNELYFLCRKESQLTLSSYSCITGEWTQHPPLPFNNKERCAVTAVNEHEFVVVGEFGGTADDTPPNFVYNVNTKSWYPLPELKFRRSLHASACVCVDNKIYAIGGLGFEGEKNTIEMLDLSMSRPEWTFLPTTMKEARRDCAAVVDYSGNIVVTGGVVENGETVTSTVEVFDTRNQVWKPAHSLPSMLTPRAFHNLVALDNGRVLVALGGRTKTDLAMASVEFLRLDNDGKPLQWIPMPSMNIARILFAAVATTQTTQPGILVARGWDENPRPLDTMEFLREPSACDIDYWTLLNPLPVEKLAPKVRGSTGYKSYQTQAEEWIDETEHKRDDYLERVTRTIQEMKDQQTQTIKKGSTPGQEQQQASRRQRPSYEGWSEKIMALQRTAKQYSLRVEERTMPVKRMVAVNRLEPPPIRGLPRASWEVRNMAQVERWIDDTEDQRMGFKRQVSVPVEEIKDELGREVDEGLQRWMEEIERGVDDYCALVDERINGAKRIIEFLHLLAPPSLKDLPGGALDATHKAEIGVWMVDTGRERRDYEVRVSAAIKDMRDDLEGRRQPDCGEIDEDDRAWNEQINTLQRTVDEYCSKVGEDMKLAKRMIGFVNRRTPPTVKDLSHLSLDMSDKAEIASWVADTDGERQDYVGRVSAAITSMRNDVVARKVCLGREVGSDGEEWKGLMNTLQVTADEYCWKVDEGIKHAKRIISVLVAYPPPPIKDIPEGELDSSHKARVEGWLEDTERQRVEYMKELTVGVEVVMKDVEGRKTLRAEQNVDVHQNDRDCVLEIDILKAISEGYSSRVEKRSKLAKQIIHCMRQFEPPNVASLPPVDFTLLERWVKDVESQRIGYDLAVNNTIKHVKNTVGPISEALLQRCEILERKANAYCSAANDKIARAQRICIVGGLGSMDGPHELWCPITREVMVDPVITVDGQTYERAAIERVFADNPHYPRSPVTGLPLSSRSLIPNVVVRSMCMDYVDST